MNTRKEKFSRLNNIVKPLLNWYAGNARILPWRENHDPYRVWISEIMLQQTRVETVIPYFQHFLEDFPTVAALAQADDSLLMKRWEGLGYYARARNLKKAARKIMELHQGNFPDSFENVRALPGIGDYTAGAILSIAFGRPVPAVDGNVLRVLTRLLELDDDIASPKLKAEFTEELRKVYPAGRTSEFTQSLMELGATVCLPNGAPKCLFCPLREQCLAQRNGSTDRIPVKAPKKDRKIEEKTVLLILCGNRFAMCKRKESGILAGMWEFPNLPGKRKKDELEKELNSMGIIPESLSKSISAKHIFSHVEWNMISYVIRTPAQSGNFSWIGWKELKEEISLPSAFKAFPDVLQKLLEDA